MSASSLVKGSAFFFKKNLFDVKKHNNVYLRLVMPSGG
jgi:hypothetical protein